MKRFLFICAALLFIGVGALFAQPIEPPGDIIEWIGALPVYLGSWPGVAISFPFLVAFVLGILNQTEAKKFVKYLITGAVGLILLVKAYLFDFGYLNGAYWWWIPINLVGLMLTEVVAYSLIGGALDALADKLNPWKPKKE